MNSSSNIHKGSLHKHREVVTYINDDGASGVSSAVQSIGLYQNVKIYLPLLFGEGCWDGHSQAPLTHNVFMSLTKQYDP